MNLLVYNIGSWKSVHYLRGSVHSESPTSTGLVAYNANVNIGIIAD